MLLVGYSHCRNYTRKQQTSPVLQSGSVLYWEESAGHALRDALDHLVRPVNLALVRLAERTPDAAGGRRE